ncbi:MAG: hypothetical protein ABI333_27980 [bacterium]
MSSRLLVVVVAAVLWCCGPGKPSRSGGAKRAVSTQDLEPVSLKMLPGTADPAVQQELDRLARCFHRAVTVNQGQPAAGKLGPFLRRALAKGGLPAECSSIPLPRAGEALKTKAGKRIRFRHAARGEDHYGGGKTVLHIVYRFTCDGCIEKAKTTIQLAIGGKP